MELPELTKGKNKLPDDEFGKFDINAINKEQQHK